MISTFPTKKFFTLTFQHTCNFCFQTIIHIILKLIKRHSAPLGITFTNKLLLKLLIQLRSDRKMYVIDSMWVSYYVVVGVGVFCWIWTFLMPLLIQLNRGVVSLQRVADGVEPSYVSQVTQIPIDETFIIRVHMLHQPFIAHLHESFNVFLQM